MSTTTPSYASKSQTLRSPIHKKQDEAVEKLSTSITQTYRKIHTLRACFRIMEQRENCRRKSLSFIEIQSRNRTTTH